MNDQIGYNGAVRVLSAYDHQHRRVRKTVQRLSLPAAAPPMPPPPGEWTTTETHTYFYDGWNLIEERIARADGTAATNRYVWGKDLSGTLQGAGGVGGLLAALVSESPAPNLSTFQPSTFQLYFPCYDHNGNVTRYLDSSGTTVAAYAYDAFGNTISATGPLADAFHHRFSTKYYDAEAGLYYYGYRFYSPSLMRWLNRDPIEENGGWNLYTFCENKISSTDHLGLYVNVEYDVANKTLTAKDVDSGASITLKEKVYSGNGRSCCVKDDQWKIGIGPLPTGRYLIGLSYVPTQHSSDDGDYNWYRLYGSNGKGGYTYNNMPVKTPTGAIVYRGGFNLHTGRASDGCVTVWSDVSQGDKGYPHSDDYDKLKTILDKTKPLRYMNSNYTGWLEVK